MNGMHPHTAGSRPVTTREAIELQIERLIELLDAIDGDPDLEPSLGYSPYVADAATCDLEGDPCDDGEPEEDDHGIDDDFALDTEPEWQPAVPAKRIGGGYRP